MTDISDMEAELNALKLEISQMPFQDAQKVYALASAIKRLAESHPLGIVALAFIAIEYGVAAEKEDAEGTNP